MISIKGHDNDNMGVYCLLNSYIIILHALNIHFYNAWYK